MAISIIPDVSGIGNSIQDSEGLNNNFKTVLISNMQNRIYIILVEKENIKKFNKYCKDEKLKIIIWLDDQSKINKLQNF